MPLNRDIWSELAKGGNVSATRRELQREHINRIAGTLLRPSPQTRADARSLLRMQAHQLQAQLDKALQHQNTMDAATRAHCRTAPRRWRRRCRRRSCARRGLKRV